MEQIRIGEASRSTGLETFLGRYRMWLCRSGGAEIGCTCVPQLALDLPCVRYPAVVLQCLLAYLRAVK